jgi:hypothetical protein
MVLHAPIQECHSALSLLRLREILGVDAAALASTLVHASQQPRVLRSDDFVTAAAFLPGTQLIAAAAGSSKERANEFAQRHGFQRAHGSYLELAQDKDVDIVYVGNVHPQHRVRLRGAQAPLQGSETASPHKTKFTCGISSGTCCHIQKVSV